MIERPAPDEHDPFYAGYVARVPAGTDPLELLEAQRPRLRSLTAAVTAAREEHRYATGKWSVREVFGHLIDAERVFGHRAFRIGRGDETPLPGFEENEYVARSRYAGRRLAALVAELVLVRDGNLALFRSFGEEEWRRTGRANDHSVSVRALAFILAGHVEHHLAILHERYGLPAEP